jgi:hypothetical protein
MLGLEPKRFLGYCMRNGLGDPISDGQMVYGWSCAQLAERLAAIKSVRLTDTSGAVQP